MANRLERAIRIASAVAFGVAGVGLYKAVEVAGENAQYDLNILKIAKDVPRLVGPHTTELDPRYNLPERYRSAETIRQILLGTVVSNRMTELQQWRRENNINPASIELSQPRDDGSFTAIFSGKEVTLSELPGIKLSKNPEDTVREKIEFDYMLTVNGKRYGIIVSTEYLGEDKARNPVFAPSLQFFALPETSFVVGLPKIN
ncbi:hypothetical protein HYT18_01460 [Candidatus Microgenomates bacterium]|nr:hypothetical protein [Candidatus Microgenomates bacterium]